MIKETVATFKVSSPWENLIAMLKRGLQPLSSLTSSLLLNNSESALITSSGAKYYLSNKMPDFETIQTPGETADTHNLEAC